MGLFTTLVRTFHFVDYSLSLNPKTTCTHRPQAYLPITENIHTTVQHQMAGCQRGLSLSKLATRGYNNVITTHKRITRKKKIRATADAECSRKKVYTEQYQEKEVQQDIEGT